MIWEILLFTAWLFGSVILTTGGFFLGRFLVRKIDMFFDKRRRP